MFWIGLIVGVVLATAVLIGTWWEWCEMRREVAERLCHLDPSMEESV